MLAFMLQVYAYIGVERQTIHGWHVYGRPSWTYRV